MASIAFDSLGHNVDPFGQNLDVTPDVVDFFDHNINDILKYMSEKAATHWLRKIEEGIAREKMGSHRFFGVPKQEQLQEFHKDMKKFTLYWLQANMLKREPGEKRVHIDLRQEKGEILNSVMKKTGINSSLISDSCWLKFSVNTYVGAPKWGAPAFMAWNGKASGRGETIIIDNVYDMQNYEILGGKSFLSDFKEWKAGREERLEKVQNRTVRVVRRYSDKTCG